MQSLVKEGPCVPDEALERSFVCTQMETLMLTQIGKEYNQFSLQLPIIDEEDTSLHLVAVPYASPTAEP
jgi:hypothetical protein